MQNTWHTQHKLRYLDIEFHAVTGLHLVTTAHRTDLRGQNRAAGIFETLVRSERGLFADNALPTDFLNMVIGIRDDPVPADKLGGIAAGIGDIDGVGKHKAVTRFVGLIRQIIYLCPYDKTMLIVFFHARHLNRFFPGSQGEISGYGEPINYPDL